jgi:hypothetical protein
MIWVQETSELACFPPHSFRINLSEVTTGRMKRSELWHRPDLNSYTSWHSRRESIASGQLPVSRLGRVLFGGYVPKNLFD